MSSEDGYVVFDVNKGVIQATKDLGEAKDAAGFFTRRDKEPAFGIDVSGSPGSGSSRQSNPPPGKALSVAGLDPVSYREVFPFGEDTKEASDRSLALAWDVLRPYFPTQDSRRGYAPYLVGEEEGAWKNTLSGVVASGILKKNAKMAKLAGSDEPASTAFGLSLIPASMASGNAKHQLVNSSNQPLLPGDDVGKKHFDWTEASSYAQTFRPREGGKLKSFNLCPSATEECRRSCLVYTGQNDAVKNYPKLMMTFALQNHPAQFARLLVAAVDHYFGKKGEGARFVRLNVYSDVAWESFFNDGKNPRKSWFFERLARKFPMIASSTEGGVPRVYDYTKVYDRIGNVPEGYDLTFSYSGTDANKAQCMDLLSKGRARVVIVFLRGKYEWKKKLFPENYFPFGQYGPSRHGHTPRSMKHSYEFLGFPLVDGERHDFRPYDPQGVWVALRWKSPKGFDILPHEEAAVLADPDRSIRGPVQPAEVVKKFVVKAKWVGGEWVSAVQPNKTNAVSVS